MINVAQQAQALEEVRFTAIQNAIRARDVRTLKLLWNDVVVRWDDRTFYDFVASSRAFSKLSFRHREVFGQVGFGTGGWDSDYPNSMLEIFRVAMTNCDRDQRLVVGALSMRGVVACAYRGLSQLEVSGRGVVGWALTVRPGIDQPLEVLAGQWGEPAGFGAADGSQAGIRSGLPSRAAWAVPARTVRIGGARGRLAPASGLAP